MPDDLLAPPERRGGARPDALLRFLADRGLPPPTLVAIEAERARRGMRTLPIGSTTPPTPLVLPYGGTSGPPESVRPKGARQNRARIMLALGGASLYDVDRLAAVLNAEARQGHAA